MQVNHPQRTMSWIFQRFCGESSRRLDLRIDAAGVRGGVVDEM
jgi:hypothetical protein